MVCSGPFKNNLMKLDKWGEKEEAAGLEKPATSDEHHLKQNRKNLAKTRQMHLAFQVIPLLLTEA